jgi:hypothetical protein
MTNYRYETIYQDDAEADVGAFITAICEKGYDFVATVPCVAVDREGGNRQSNLLVFRPRDSHRYARLIRVAMDAATACRIIESCVNSDYDSEHNLAAIADALEAAARAVTA